MGLGKTLQCITLLWYIYIHTISCVYTSVHTCSLYRTLLKQGPYGRKKIARRVIVITPGSLVKVINTYIHTYSSVFSFVGYP